MSDEPENLMLRDLRRLDERTASIFDELREVKHRLTTVEVQVGQMLATEQSHYAAMMGRHDQTDRRLERIERRLDLADSPA
jgi:uncharacterized protein YdcH (DUF465 family)